MVTQYREFELLERMLKRDSWTKEEACWFFLGCWQSNGDIFDLVSCQRLDAQSSGKAWDDFSDIKKRWSASNIDRDFAQDLDRYDKYYCLVWAQDHGAWNLAQELVAWGEEHKLIQKDKIDLVREELLTPEEPPPTQISEKMLNNRLRLIGVLLSILTKQETKTAFKSENQLIQHIQENYKGYGLSERLLKDLFRDAKKLVDLDV